MNLLCRLFGHPLPKDPTDSAPAYGNTQFMWTDGMGVNHYRVTVMCQRCGTDFAVANIYGPREELRPESAD